MNSSNDTIHKYENDLGLIDLIEACTLQKMQDSFTGISDMPIQFVDADGEPVTEMTVGEKVCSEFDCCSPAQCLKEAERSENDLPDSEIYHCKAKRKIISVPIKLDEYTIGSVVGLFDENSDDDSVKKTIEALKKITDSMSDIAYKSYQLKKDRIDAENVSKIKSDFLANMSHEIRTPMNAVLGMVDLALREEMPDAARDYIGQIRVAGKNLLSIINDILDFSKIESGEMEITLEVYEPLKVIDDVANIINARIGDKDIEFTMDIAPDLPKKVYGDSAHIHQILINILNNAVKFTRKGKVNLHIACEFGEKDEVVICVAVSDTGIGIKDEDKQKLFVSFQQVDTKRNRNVEGTGLGLAITKQLLTLMNGSITFESEFRKGSVFYIRIPQKCIERMPDILPVKEKLRTFVCLENEYLKEQLFDDLTRVGIEYTEVVNCDDLEKERPKYLLIDKNNLTTELVRFYEKNPTLQCLAVAEYSSRSSTLLSNIHVIRKPVYSLQLYNAMKICNIELLSDDSQPDEFKFVAPTAHILIVDDNAVNLAVAKGLLEPLKMKIDLAGNAGEAIELLMEKEYDLIFMDHMMPEVDGIDATRIIRRLMPEYDDVPIIALTANAVSGAREMFIAEGMADFVAKPIDVKDICSKLFKWLPREKIIPVDEDEVAEALKESEEEEFAIPGLDTANAVKGLGSKELYITVVNEYFKAISNKSELIKRLFDEGDIHNYTIEVHSLKSTSRQIGALELGELAAELEAAGKNNDTALIKEKTDKMLEMYIALKETLRPYVTVEENVELKSASPDELIELFENLAEALASFDALLIDEIVEKLSGFKYETDTQQGFLEEMKTAAEITDIDTIERIIAAWKEELTSL